MRLSRTMIVAALPALLVAGCGSIGDRVSERVAEEVTERVTDSDVDIDMDSGEIAFETDEGTVRIGGGDLPPEFPSAMPVPDHVQVIGSSSSSSDGREEVGAQIHVEAGFDTTVDYFERELPGSGWQITDTQRMSIGDDVSNVMFQVTGHGWEGVVTVQQLGAEGDDETIMGVLYALSAES